jgi:type III restriction enzyme
MYMEGAIQRGYIPDFIVIDDADVHWVVEGKADSEMLNPIVLAKAAAAKEWVSTVNASENVSQKWGYLLASEQVTAAAANWNALRTGAGAFTS